MSKKILVMGSGFIGQRVGEYLGSPVSSKMIRSFNDAESEIERHRPKVIINSIGYTGKNVDYCEKNRDTTLTANTYVPIVLADIAYRRKIKLVHISSGCIYSYDYSRDFPIKESKSPDFFGLYYSRTKIYAEKVLEKLGEKTNILIVRIRIPLDERPHPKNILTKLINYGKVIDVPNSVTYIPDFLKALRHLIGKDARGIYNVVNEGGLRYPRLMDIYKKYNADFSYKLIDYRKLNMVRTNLLLSTRKLKGSGFKVRRINDVLEECVRGYTGGLRGKC